MITTKEIRIKRCFDLTSEYVENTLNQMGFDVLRWAITDYDDDTFLVNIAIVEN